MSRCSISSFLCPAVVFLKKNNCLLIIWINRCQKDEIKWTYLISRSYFIFNSWKIFPLDPNYPKKIYSYWHETKNWKSLRDNYLHEFIVFRHKAIVTPLKAKASCCQLTFSLIGVWLVSGILSLPGLILSDLHQISR